MTYSALVFEQDGVEIGKALLSRGLHIDPADEENGCLKVIPGSHERGLLKQAEIEATVKSNIAVPCVVEAGDVVIMRPHILHSSSKAKRPNHRRVVHLEYASYELPDGISWA
jgi:ectoine hydroxylase-related dioxygenase (phytanoyl-CoA dioxygenase family)